MSYACVIAALSMLREELEELQEENSALRSRQSALLEAIEGSMNKDQLADGLRDFLQAQVKTILAL